MGDPEPGRLRIRNLINVNETIIQTYEELIKSTKIHHKNCNISRTVSTMVGIAGSAVAVTGVIVAAVSTGGVALVAAPIIGWVGFGVGMGGAATGFGTEIADIFISRSTKKKSISLRKRQIEAMDNCREEIDALVNIIDDENISCNFPWKNCGLVVKDAVLAAGRFYKPVALVGKAIKYGKNGGVLAKLAPEAHFVTKGIRLLSKHPVILGVAGGVIFAAFDIAFLYHSWTSAHELETELHKTIQKFQAANFGLRLLIDPALPDSIGFERDG